MWSLPDIQRLNAEAKAEAPDFREQVRLGFKPTFRQRIPESNWIELTEENIQKVDTARARKAQHVIGVEMPVPEGIEFYDNAEFDSMDGHQISGESVQSILESAREDGHKKAILILDAGYQFAVSIGVYVPKAAAAKAA